MLVPVVASSAEDGLQRDFRTVKQVGRVLTSRQMLPGFNSLQKWMNTNL